MHVGRGLYYGSYKSPRILVWSIGVIILILMMAIAFLGYIFSPKWFNINILFYFSLLFIFLSIIIIKIKIDKINTELSKKDINKKRTILRELKNNKLNNITYHPNLLTRCYSTHCFSLKNVYSDRLVSIIKELHLNPVYQFENLNLENIRKEIKNETKGLSGIYMILNKITKDYYIGSASNDRIYSRFSNHVIYFRGSKIVKLAVQKYKLENFAFLILDLFPTIVTKENNKELIDLEDKYLKLLLPNYNILTEAGSSFGYKHTDIDRTKFTDIYSDARLEISNNLNKLTNFSKETIYKIREKSLNILSPFQPIYLKSLTSSVIIYNLNGTIYGKYPTIKEASKAINCKEKTIRRALKTDKKLIKKQ